MSACVFDMMMREKAVNKLVGYEIEKYHLISRCFTTEQKKIIFTSVLGKGQNDQILQISSRAKKEKILTI